MREPLVQVRNLGIGFTSQAELVMPILRNIDLTISEGETIGLVGESGCGKSTLALAMMGYLKSGLSVLEGESLFRGRNVFDMDKRALEGIRGGELALIPQNAGQSLTPWRWRRAVADRPRARGDSASTVPPVAANAPATTIQ